MFRKPFLKVFFAFIAFTPWLPNYAWGQMVVTDPASLKQTILLLTESIKQTAQMVEDAKVRIQQYELMLQNVTKPENFVWGDAEKILEDIGVSTETIEKYKEKFGDIDKFVKKYKNLADYVLLDPSDPDYEKKLAEQKEFVLEVVGNTANDLFKFTDQQKESLKEGLESLKQIQNMVQNAKGALDSVSYQNQLATNMAEQMLQMRTTLVSQATAYAAKIKAELEEKAQKDAILKKLTDFSQFKEYTGSSTWLKF